MLQPFDSGEEWLICFRFPTLRDCDEVRLQAIASPPADQITNCWAWGDSVLLTT
jgi:hypothetical protein